MKSFFGGAPTPSPSVPPREVKRLSKIIDALPNNQHTMLILTEIEDRSANETAQIMALSPKTVV